MRPRHDDPRAPGLTLWRAFVIFTRRRSPRILFTLAALMIAVRLWVGAFGIWDVLLMGLLVGMHPITEWVIHVYLLHFRPRRVLGRRFDFRIARDHRRHHAAPHDETWWFIPLSSELIAFGAVTVVSIALLPTWPLRTTAIMTMSLLGLLYEWTHYLCHASYRPRSTVYRNLVRHHRLHHFKNEHYWMGVTMHAGDRLLGTMPDPHAVPLSPTCRELLRDEPRP